MHRSDSFHGRLEIVERARRYHRRDLGRHSISFVTFVDNDYARRLLRGIDQRFFVERPHGSRIDDLRADVEFLEQIGGAERHLHHAARCDDRDVGAHALHIRDAERNGVVLCRHRAFELVHHFVFEKDHGIVVANRCLQKSLRVIRCGRQYNLQSRNVAKPGVQRLRVLRARPACGAERSAHHHRNFPLPTGHVVNLRGLIDHLVHNERREITEHDVDDGTHARHCSPHGNARETGFGDRRIQHALGAELVDEPREDLEYRTGFRDVFTANEHPRVAAHLFRHRFTDGFG